MSDRIAVMNNGVLDQVGTAEEIYDNPSTKFVADFVGQINFLPGTVISSDPEWTVVDIPGGRSKVRSNGLRPLGRNVTVAIRPERLRIGKRKNGEVATDAIRGTIRDIGFAGNLSMVCVDLSDANRVNVEVRRSDDTPTIGESVTVDWDPADSIILAE